MLGLAMLRAVSVWLTCLCLTKECVYLLYVAWLEIA